MFKEQILRRGLQKAPEDLEVNILLYAADKIEKDESGHELSDYLSWLPFVGILLLLKDLMSGQKVRISPAVKI
ncbi:MAG: hypothetical protein P9M11_05280 [Candidatus Tenebribacter burtonii]|jgi:hypothetical protein|nr:hypothetical protein [Candidatus Tenebribacter burtonii]